MTYPSPSELTQHPPRGRLTGAAIAATVVLALDAVAAMAGALVLVLPVLLRATDYESGPGRADVVVAVLGVTALLALVCPAVAALVCGVRTRGAYLAGVVVSGLVAVTVAGEAALWLKPELSLPAVVAGVVFAGNLGVVFLVLGLLRPGEDA
jgi:hypothetical protein